MHLFPGPGRGPLSRRIEGATFTGLSTQKANTRSFLPSLPAPTGNLPKKIPTLGSAFRSATPSSTRASAPAKSCPLMINTSSSSSRIGNPNSCIQAHSRKAICQWNNTLLCTEFRSVFRKTFGKSENSAYLCTNKKRPAQHEALSSYLRG